MTQSNKPIVDAIFFGTGVAGTAVSATLSEVLGLILTCINIIYLLVILTIKIVSKVQKAKEDGKIDEDEVKDIEKTIHDGLDEVNQHGKKDR